MSSLGVLYSNVACVFRLSIRDWFFGLLSRLFIYQCSIICMEVKYIDQSLSNYWHILGFDTYIFRRRIADWSIARMIPEVKCFAKNKKREEASNFN